MTKQELINKIEDLERVARNSIEVAYVFAVGNWMTALENFKTPAPIEICGVSKKSVYVLNNPSELVLKYKNPLITEETCLNLIRSGIKDMITLSYENSCEYSNKTNQFTKLKTLNWFYFTKIIRNSLSHDYLLNFINPYNQKIIPDQKLSFSGGDIELKYSMQGQELDFDILPVTYCFELVDMIKESIKKDLI